jgi:hypothetical protein
MIPLAMGTFTSHLHTVHAIYEGSVRKGLLGFEELIPPLHIRGRIVKLFKWSNAIWPIASEVEKLSEPERWESATPRPGLTPNSFCQPEKAYFSLLPSYACYLF